MKPHRSSAPFAPKFLLGAFVLVCGYLPGLALGQTAADAGGDTIHVHGTVVDGVTGKPIARALVSSVDRRLATMTNNEGAFVLDVSLVSTTNNDLQATAAAGGAADAGFRLYLEVRKPGYLEPQTRLSVPLANPASTTTLKLMPAGVVEGHLTANAAEPPSKVAVSLLMHTVVNGERVWNLVGGQQTSREGAFYFSNLRPGEYAVMSNEWRGDEPLPPSPTAVTEQYPPVYYGDSATLAGAARIRLHYGETAQTDLHLRLEKYFPVVVPVGGAGAGVNVRVLTGEAQSGYQLGYNQADHAVEGALPPGTYTLLINSYRPQQAYASVVLHVGEAPVKTAEVVPQPAAPIAVRVHREFTGKGTPPERLNARVYLMPQEQGLAFASAVPQPGQEDALVLPDVEPGRYMVRAEAAYGYAAEIRSGGDDLKIQPLVVGDGGAGAPIDVTFRDDGGSLSGTVLTGDQPLPQMTMACLIPLQAGGQLFLAGMGADGKFALTNVFPGSYRLFASTVPPWGIPWQDPEALRALSQVGTEVTVTPNATLTVDAPLVDERALELP